MGRNQLKPTSSTFGQYLTVEKKWPANENTHLIGDINNWSKYRPNVERSINFTGLIEEKTIYDHCQTLRPYLIPPSHNKSKTLFLSVDQTSMSLLCNRNVDNPTKWMSSTVIFKPNTNGMFHNFIHFSFFFLHLKRIKS